jgi:monothiol glutaredoxin
LNFFSIFKRNTIFFLKKKISIDEDKFSKNIIQDHIDTKEVCLFMKGTPDAPQCGFSMAVTNMLKLLEVNFQSVNVLENQNIREGIKIFSDWPTIPQLYIKKEFVGGCDIVKEMYENGELKKVLEDKGINFKK